MTSTQIDTITDSPDGRKGETRNKTVAWYQPSLEYVNQASRDLLEKYSHIPPEKVIPHILQIRDKAWDIKPYPCIGQLRFIDLSMRRLPSYPSLVSRLKNGALILDIGCCFAQDLRQLVHDGVPSTNLYGADLKLEYLSLSYELFRDKDTFHAHFMQADILEEGGALDELVGKMDIVHAGLFLHLWGLEGQTKVCERIVRLLKPEKGVTVNGQQVGSTVSVQLPEESGSRMFKHNVESFEKMWQEVGERTGTEWKVSATLDSGLGIDLKKRTWDDPNTRRLEWEVERIK